MTETARDIVDKDLAYLCQNCARSSAKWPASSCSSSAGPASWATT